MEKAKRRVHTYIPVPGTWYFADTWYHMFERKHSAARLKNAPQGKALHRTIPHGVALRAAELKLS